MLSKSSSQFSNFILRSYFVRVVWIRLSMHGQGFFTRRVAHWKSGLDCGVLDLVKSPGVAPCTYQCVLW